MDEQVEIYGALLRSFLNAGESLELLLQDDSETVKSLEQDKWYPIELFRQLLRRTSEYINSDNIIEQIGIEMMKGWYHHGPGKSIISTGLDFLTFQTSSRGFRSVVKGPPELVGNFDLINLDAAGGTATVHSTTVFPRALERGILIGGLGLAGDLLYYAVSNALEADRFDIFFVTPHNRTTLTWHRGDVPGELQWKLKHLERQTADKEKYWQSINETLNAAYLQMREALREVKVLSGLLPICASCKKIRDDKGYWRQIELYIRDHTGAEFSHSICPECIRKLYPGMSQDADSDINA